MENAFYRKAVHPGGFSVSCCHFSCVIFIGIQMASAYVGSTFIPPLFGLLGNLISFSILPFYLIFFIVVMITMTELTFRITANSGKKVDSH